VRTLEAVIAGLLALGGVRSLVYWLRRPFHPATPGERMLYVLNLTGRVGWWFALAAFFLAWAVVDEPQSAGWFLLLPIVLAGVQLLTGFLLAHREDEDAPLPDADQEFASGNNGHGPTAGSGG